MLIIADADTSDRARGLRGAHLAALALSHEIIAQHELIEIGRSKMGTERHEIRNTDDPVAWERIEAATLIAPPTCASEIRPRRRSKRGQRTRRW